MKALNDRLASKFFASYLIAFILYRHELILLSLFKIESIEDKINRMHSTITGYGWILAFLFSLIILIFYYFGNYVASGIGEKFILLRSKLQRSITREEPVNYNDWKLIDEQNKSLQKKHDDLSVSNAKNLEEINNLKKSNDSLKTNNQELLTRNNTFENNNKVLEDKINKTQSGIKQISRFLISIEKDNPWNIIKENRTLNDLRDGLELINENNPVLNNTINQVLKTIEKKKK